MVVHHAASARYASQSAGRKAVSTGAMTMSSPRVRPVDAPFAEVELGTQRAAWGLRRYVAQVAHGLGIGLESACCEVGATPTVYLALDERLPDIPDQNTALCWDVVHGWALGVETGSDEQVHLVAYLGGSEVLPVPEVVVVFAKSMLAGHPVGQAEPPVLVGEKPGTRLADYASPGICHDDPENTTEGTATRRRERE